MYEVVAAGIRLIATDNAARVQPQVSASVAFFVAFADTPETHNAPLPVVFYSSELHYPAD